MNVRKCVPVALTKAQAMTTKRKKRIDKRILLEPFLQPLVESDLTTEISRQFIGRISPMSTFFSHVSKKNI